jgi:hypothetical protein
MGGTLRVGQNRSFFSIGRHLHRRFMPCHIAPARPILISEIGQPPLEMVDKAAKNAFIAVSLESFWRLIRRFGADHCIP